MFLDVPGATIMYLDFCMKGFIFKCTISNMRNCDTVCLFVCVP